MSTPSVSTTSAINVRLIFAALIVAIVPIAVGIAAAVWTESLVSQASSPAGFTTTQAAVLVHHLVQATYANVFSMVLSALNIKDTDRRRICYANYDQRVLWGVLELFSLGTFLVSTAAFAASLDALAYRI